MEFLRSQELPADPPDASFREARGLKLIIAPVFLALAVLAFPPIFRWVFDPKPTSTLALGLVSVILALVGAAAGHDLKMSFRSTNWILRAWPRGLLVKYRSFRNAHLPEEGPIAVLFAPHEIEGIGRLIRWVPTKRGRKRKEILLDIVLVEGDYGELAERLERERREIEACPTPFIGFKDTYRTVRLVDGRVLRIEWDTTAATTVPGLDEALENLERLVPIRQEPWEGQGVETKVELPVDPADEARLRELAAAGRTLEAVRLARRIYGVPLKEARERVDALGPTGRGAGTGAGPA
jgi:hypothetical protein